MYMTICVFFFFKILLSNSLASQSSFMLSLLGKGRHKIIKHGLGHITKMADMPICYKNLKTSSIPEPEVIIMIFKQGMEH